MTRVKSTTHFNPESSQNRTPTIFARSTRPAGIRARGRRGDRLTSSRDRQRLRERNNAERERVEGAMASAAFPIERRAHYRGSTAPEYTVLGPCEAETAGCPVCGDGRIVTDEVMHGGTLRVSECLHCEHRWTHRPTQRWVELGATMNRTARPRALQAVEEQPARP